MKRKMRKMLMVILTASIVGIIFVAGRNSIDEEDIEQILKAKDTLLESENLRVTYDVTLELDQESQTYVNEIIVNNETKEWYCSIGNIIGGETVIFNESLILKDTMYNRFENCKIWNINPDNKQKIYGLHNISNIELVSEDYIGINKSNTEDNTIISIKASKRGMNRFKEEVIKEMEIAIEEYKKNPGLSQKAIAISMINLEALKETNYKEIIYTFIIDKSEVLIGYNSYFEIEQPEVMSTPDGEFRISEELVKLSMASKIVINSYNNSENVELIEGFKGQVVK